MVGVGAVVGVDAYRVIVRAVEEGVAYGWQRAHKHTDTPTADVVKDTVADAALVSCASGSGSSGGGGGVSERLLSAAQLSQKTAAERNLGGTE